MQQTSGTAPHDDIHHKSITGIEHRLTPLVSSSASACHCMRLPQLKVDEKVSKYASYIFEPLDTSLWSVTHEEDGMKVCSPDCLACG